LLLNSRRKRPVSSTAANMVSPKPTCIGQPPTWFNLLIRLFNASPVTEKMDAWTGKLSATPAIPLNGAGDNRHETLHSHHPCWIEHPCSRFWNQRSSGRAESCP